MKTFKMVLNKLVIVLAVFVPTLLILNIADAASETAVLVVGVAAIIVYLMYRVRENIRYITGYRLPQGEEG